MNDSKLHIWPENEPDKTANIQETIGWRTIHDEWPQLMGIGHIKKYKIVIDVNMILADMKFKHEHPNEKTVLERLHFETMIELIAPHWLISELRCGTCIDEFSGKFRHITKNNLWKQWPAIQKIITIDKNYLYPYKSTLRDMKDEPYLTMMKDSGALGILTQDKGFTFLKSQKLSRSDLEVIDELFASLEQLAEVKLITIGIPTYGLHGLSVGLQAGYKKLPTLPKSVQLGILFTGLAGLCAWLHPTGRKFITKAGKDTLAKLRPVSDEYLRMLVKGSTLEKHAKNQVSKIERGRYPDATPT